ncbi:hypothetical protein K1I90_07425 [Streptococcus gordonii]|nr:hypothetical protein [Streptococcus gordonii]MBZ2142535.1 hypothetical protein [Streptococcus gordonii]MBZ2144334.1 hypothetical protein [Streptococcus gordonii]MBZ2146439.1 hypothetical protein [Streptococcus gordonii]
MRSKTKKKKKNKKSKSSGEQVYPLVGKALDSRSSFRLYILYNGWSWRGIFNIW